MYGAIAGDVIGSVHERIDDVGDKNYDFELFPMIGDETTFTDDTVLTVAVAHRLLEGGEYADFFRRYVTVFPGRGYGGRFANWAANRAMGPYNSWGNGGAMRVSPIGWAFYDFGEVLGEAKASAEVTHNHPEGIKGAQAVAGAVSLARKVKDKQVIRWGLQTEFGYDLDRSVEQIRPEYRFDVSAAGSVPEAIICFLDAEDFESAVRNAVSLGGDADTQACIAGAIAEAYYGGVPRDILETVRGKLPESFRLVADAFCDRYVGV